MQRRERALIEQSSQFIFSTTLSKIDNLCPAALQPAAAIYHKTFESPYPASLLPAPALYHKTFESPCPAALLPGAALYHKTFESPYPAATCAHSPTLSDSANVHVQKTGRLYSLQNNMFIIHQPEDGHKRRNM